MTVLQIDSFNFERKDRGENHIYNNCSDKIPECFVAYLVLSDHYPICFTRKFSNAQNKRTHYTIKYRSFTKFDENALLNELSTEIANLNCSQEDSNFYFSIWNNIFISILNKHAPIKEKRIKRK